MGGLSEIVTLTPVQFWGLIVLFLPGFISLKLHRFIQRHDGTTAEALIDVVGFSLLNALVMAWPIYVVSTHLASAAPDWTTIVLDAFWVCVVGPTLWPGLFQIVKRYALRGDWLLGEQKRAFDAFFSSP